MRSINHPLLWLALVWIISLGAGSAVAQPFGLTTRTVISGLNFPLDDPAAVGGGGGTVQLVRAFPSLTFSQPVFITSSRDGTNRIFIVEKTGRIRVFQNSDSVSATTTFLDISSRVSADGEQGLLSMAFDPGFTQNGYFYVYYSASTGPRRSVISRFRVTSNPNVADAASESVILEVRQPDSYSNHKGGMIAFGQDGMLYISLGDGGGGGDPLNSGQDCSDMLGNILRIDPRGASPYGVPADNPYAGSGTHSCGSLSGAASRVCGINGYSAGQICAEVWACGLRNPWRFSFDRVAGSLWAGDVGQGAREEIDLIRPADNLGWRIFEGTQAYNNPGGLPASAFRAPIIDYPRSQGYSVTGGYVYRGNTLPSIYGRYIYGDYGSGRIWSLNYDGAAVVSNTQIASLAGVVSFGEDEAGELYAVSINTGTAHRFVPGGSGGGPVIPTRLSQTGIFANLQSLQAVAGAVEFDVNAPLWSDAALKKRWILLPGTERIAFSATGAYDFPIGTALVKHFELTLSPGVNRRLETRVLFRHNQGWTGYTYKWNEAQSEAELLTEAARQTFTVQDAAAPGGARQQEWYFPSRADCLSCHTAPAGRVLGVRTRQLNRNFNYSGVVDNQLRSWNHINLFTADIGAHTAYEAYPDYADGAKPVEQRSRAYLEVNCAHCHHPAIPRSGEVDLRYDTPLASTGLLNTAPTYGDLGLTNPARIRVGRKESSVLWERMRRLDSFRMPLLGSSLVDQSAVDLIGTWIDFALGGDSVPPSAPRSLRVQ